MQIVTHGDGAQGFVVLARRWVVERTLAWLMTFGRLSKDYEETSTSSQAGIRLAGIRLAMIHIMIHIMVRRLA